MIGTTRCNFEKKKNKIYGNEVNSKQHLNSVYVHLVCMYKSQQNPQKSQKVRCHDHDVGLASLISITVRIRPVFDEVIISDFQKLRKVIPSFNY